jgi:hypothetical protein
LASPQVLVRIVRPLMKRPDALILIGTTLAPPQLLLFSCCLIAQMRIIVNHQV